MPPINYWSKLNNIEHVYFITAKRATISTISTPSNTLVLQILQFNYSCVLLGFYEITSDFDSPLVGILGLANRKTVSIQAGGKDLSVVLATTKTKKQNKPADLTNKSVMRKEFRRMAKAVVNQVAENYYRPDLKNAALARLSAVHRSLKVANSGVKKRNRQAVKISGRKLFIIINIQ
ncbi:Ribosomal L28e/Mak16, partial [Dillenia turbinata]